MFLVAGLGNPGEKYKDNRHNIGFMILDNIIKNNSLNNFKKRKNFFYSINNIENKDVLFIKPTTYMNNSGRAITSAMAFFKIKPENILVIFDDVALPIGKLRIREHGSDGGHNGLKSIIQQLGTQEVKRIRIGAGAPLFPGQIISHVLGDLSSDDKKIIHSEIYPCVDDSIILIINDKIKEAMNKYNGLDFKESSQ